MKKSRFSLKGAVAASQNKKEREYWLNKLAGAPGKYRFPFDRTGTGIPMVDPAAAAADDDDAAGNKSEYRMEQLNTRIPDQLTAKLLRLSNESDVRLHMILVSSLILLIHKYSGSEDIIVGTSIYRQEKDVEFINTVLPLRNHIKDKMTFKELLLQVRETLYQAVENQDYPLEALLYQLNIPVSGSDFPLFDIVLLLENIHRENYIRHITPNVLFLFNRQGENIPGEIRYNAVYYRRATIERITGHFYHLLQNALINLDSPINHIGILPAEEKKQLLIDFNDTADDYPANRTIHSLFQQQVEKSPQETALVFAGQTLTYRQLEKKALGMALMLRKKGLQPDTAAALVVEPSIDMVVGILGILMAGGAYLPIDSDYPGARQKFILEDSRAAVLLTQRHLVDKTGSPWQGISTANMYCIDDEAIYDFAADDDCRRSGLIDVNRPGDAAYIIYTSGTTGKPKGVMVEHRNALNVIHWFAATYQVQKGTRILGLTDYTFDPSIEDIFGALLNGAALYVVNNAIASDVGAFHDFVKENCIHIVDFVPVVLKELLCHREKLPDLRVVISGGERLRDSIKDDIIKKGYALYNHYGPTEITVDALMDKCSVDSQVILGKPIYNTKCYILGKDNNLLPIGIYGELCVAGAGVSRGYLNNPELTREKFIVNKFNRSHRSYRTYINLYKTGDLARWLPEGKIEFAGRIDQQVKIRGFRIEPAEIENCLTRLNGIKQALVAAKGDEGAGKYLCAYIISDRELETTEIKAALARQLPEYMVPSYFVKLDTIPLTPNGKIDRRSLPEPVIKSAVTHMVPTTGKEKILASVWSEVLGLEKNIIGIDANFFELGGNSLKATLLTAKMQKEFDVKVPFVEIFKQPTVRGLARYLHSLEKETFVAIKIEEKKEYYPVSSAQKQLYMLQQMEKNSIAYNIPQVELLAKDFDRKKFEKVVKELIKRHEAFRTCFFMKDSEPRQMIRSRVPFEMEYSNLASGIEKGKPVKDITRIINDFVRPFDLTRAPLMRVQLIEINDTDVGEDTFFILMIDMHHIISDEVSHKILMRDFTALVESKTMPPLRLQYRDFSVWQRRRYKTRGTGPEETYWLKQFENPPPVLQLPLDYPRPTRQNFAGRTRIFELEPQQADGLFRLALKEKMTLYMVLLAIYYVFLSKISNQEDILVGTPVSGRRHADTQQIIGMFVNTLALRNKPTGEKSFKDFLEEIKKNTLEAFENQEYPFVNVVEQVVVYRTGSRNPIFDVMFAWQEPRPGPNTGTDTGITMDKQTKSPINKREKYAYQNRTAKFDMSWQGIEANGKILFAVEYCTKLFKSETITKFIDYFKRITAAVLENPQKKIAGIQIISPSHRDEKLSVLYDDLENE